MMDEMFSRSRLLLGDEVFVRLARRRVLIVGVGGVGSWAAEALVRTGLRRVTLMDFDRVAPSNINRQLEATSATVGEVKVEALRRHLLEVNPEAEVEAVCAAYTEAFPLAGFDVVIDCIDQVAAKAHLIVNAQRAGAVVYSSMGAALRRDPTRVRVGEFWRVEGDPLARALRSRFKREGVRPRFRCVYSEEAAAPRSAEGPNGSLMTVTAAFGLTLAGLVIG